MEPEIRFSRRDFLKLSAAGMLGAFLSEVWLGRSLAADVQQGRAALSGIVLYQEPSPQSKPLQTLLRDQILNITGQASGDSSNPYNSTWYQVDGTGYVYSGWIQPVETIYQKPVLNIRSGGQTGELTVPFSDTRHDPSSWAERGYRIYYRSTHWVTDVVVNRYEKTIWYKVYDSELQASLYIASQDLRLVPDEELAPLASDVPDGSKHIYVDTSTQSVTAFENDQAVLVARCSSGGKGTRTPAGDFQTFHKGPTIHMTNDGEPGAGHPYDLPGVPWVSFFTGTGISFHGTYWHNDYGTPRSHGCVNLKPDDAKFVYRWTSPVVPPGIAYLYKPGEGTKVQVVSSNS